MLTAIKKNDFYVEHKYWGPLYLLKKETFRDDGGKVYSGINGNGIVYQFYLSECIRVITREEFDSLLQK